MSLLSVVPFRLYYLRFTPEDSDLLEHCSLGTLFVDAELVGLVHVGIVVARVSTPTAGADAVRANRIQ
jgi:hypothetical protein